MKVTEKDVAYVADLANLELTPEESQRMVADLNSILGHIDKLNRLDTSDVEPWPRWSPLCPAGEGAKISPTRSAPTK